MTMHYDQRTMLDAMCRSDYPSFFGRVMAELEPANIYEENWHTIHLAYQLERVRAGECRRLMINQPPRTVKTMMSSIAFPAFVLGHDPTKRIMCVTYSKEVARDQVTEGTFPHQLKIGVHGAGWHESAINQWIANPVGWRETPKHLGTDAD